MDNSVAAQETKDEHSKLTISSDPVLLGLLHLEQHLPPPAPTLFQAAVSCVISQRIRFAAARQIRKCMFEMLGPAAEWTPDKFTKETMGDEQWAKWNVDSDKRDTIRRLAGNATAHGSNNLLLLECKGVGPWTRKAARIMCWKKQETGADIQTCSNDANLFLPEDKWIRQRLGELYFQGKTPTESEAAKFAASQECWRGQLTRVTKLIWRLTPKGANQLLQRSKTAATGKWLPRLFLL